MPKKRSIKRKFISILIPVLNDKNGLKKTLKSIFNQSFTDYEVIVIDGKSSDGTLSVIKSFRKKIKIFLSETDKGIYDAINKGIKLSTGKYINIINANDTYFNKNSLETAKKFLIKKTVDFVRDFAEIGNYFDLPFNTYSSGMRLRVTFGLSMAFHFDFYLVDEITSVGDQKFRQKCNDLLVNKVAQSSFIMVNHNLNSLKNYCDKAIVLHNGNALMYNSLSEAVKMHKYLLFE